ncbi:uncharacterized protein RAG0_01532 [Rhynchosporium agropyri]|uniref:Uncharacterized protein n=2 Tax=Rhynchosporium TaxID=38037 RepID=A0A1E1JXA8_9HELO|nr:uncharacterized protein RAG0_01532 [Rhynchosporium agropyri]CZS98425.1 uncharacterized protein RCO7_14491 [Rhynchosporium commune]
MHNCVISPARNCAAAVLRGFHTTIIPNPDAARAIQGSLLGRTQDLHGADSAELFFGQ